ncbi:MAG: amino acid racemase [Firmicutes bacterium]|nr:amino acid racemase [Candidatus Colimorpha enterica]
MNSEKRDLLGIIGGLGPMATVYFYEMLTAHTDAKSDQEHIDILISSRATTPDRTAYITGRSTDSPLPYMIEELKRLENAGVTLAVMPCNTAHYFIDELKNSARVPMLDIIEETVKLCRARGFKRLGLLATEGTASTGSYPKRAEPLGAEIVLPSEEGQKKVSEIIYSQIKKGLPADARLFSEVADEMKAKGCDTVILGCTELSLVKKQMSLGPYFTDSLEALAWSTIKRYGKKPISFDFE